MKIKIVFYGTGQFAELILKAISRNDNFSVLGVITQPDRPVGRNQEKHKSAVKILAENLAVPILQPESLKSFDDPLLREADLGVVAEYGLIIPKRLLGLPKHKTVNLHGSLLPKYRGASPIQTAIMMGDPVIGVTLMLMDEKMDHGPLISAVQIPIGALDTYEILSRRLATAAAELFLNDAPKYIAGKITPIEQDHNQATYCRILTRDDGKIDFKNIAGQIYNQYRALSPWPGIWTALDGRRCKILAVAKSAITNLKSGEISLHDDHIYVGCGSLTSLEVLSLQLEGKKILSAVEFINGSRDSNGKFFG